jgi:nucleotide-binding universal stress UspA family protein
MFEKILVAHDGSNGAWKAFEAALDLAARLRSGLHMISVAHCSVLVVK